MHSRVVPYRFQHVARTPPDAPPASGTVTFHDTDDFIPVFPPAVQVARNPQQKRNSHTNINDIHFLNICVFNNH
jgi:hypothetical protein